MTTTVTNKVQQPATAQPHGSLARTLTLPLLIFYGLGVTIGAGIYVLIGAAAVRGGTLAPLAFLLAAVVMGVTGATFAELAGRVPHSAGEAAYVRAAFGAGALAAVVGFLVLAIAVISAAAIAKGAAGYIASIAPFPLLVLTTVAILAATAIAVRGVREAVGVAAVMTLIEVGGLVAIVVGGLWHAPEAVARTAFAVWTWPTTNAALHGMLGAFLLAFFALIGFESLVNLAEEAHTPARLMPRAIAATLGLATCLYMAVMIVALALFSPAELGGSATPLALLFERTTGLSQLIVTAIAVAATFNGIIAQIILASRLIYGMARQGILPAALATVEPERKIPQAATLVAMMLVVTAAIAAPLDALADMTTRLMLVVFLVVNAALLKLKLRGEPAPPDGYIVPAAVPLCGAALCGTLLLLTFLV